MFNQDRKGIAELRDPLPFPPPAASVSSLIPPLPSLSFLLPLACPCLVWIDPDLLLPPSFPSHSSILPSHSHFIPLQITCCLYRGRGAWISLPCKSSGLGQCWRLSPSEPVSQHCPRDWSLPLAPRPWGGASQL